MSVRTCIYTQPVDIYIDIQTWAQLQGLASVGCSAFIYDMLHKIEQCQIGETRMTKVSCLKTVL